MAVDILQHLSTLLSGEMMSKALDIGCGLTPRNIFNATEIFGIDSRADASKYIISADLVVDAIPFPDDYFDFVSAIDFLEHIPRLVYVPHRRNAFVELMNEIWRVLRPDGKFLSFTPAYPHPGAFRDPTHVNFITDETFTLYFDDVNRWAATHGYGFTGSFKILSQELQGVHLQTLMQKVINNAS